MAFRCQACGNEIPEPPLAPCEECEGQVWVNTEAPDHPMSDGLGHGHERGDDE